MPLLGPFVANTLATTDVQRRQLVAETHGALPWADRARGAVDGARGRALWIHSHERSNGALVAGRGWVVWAKLDTCAVPSHTVKTIVCIMSTSD